jgi:hypothetical protein
MIHLSDIYSSTGGGKRSYGEREELAVALSVTICTLVS